MTAPILAWHFTAEMKIARINQPIVLSELTGEYAELEAENGRLRGYAFSWNVHQALRGRRGQSILREIEEALVALPARRLIQGEFVTASGEVCALGALAVARGRSSGLSRAETATEIRRAINLREGADELAEIVGDELGIGELVASAWRLEDLVEGRWREPLELGETTHD